MELKVQDGMILPKSDFLSIIVSRHVDAGYESRNEPLLVVGEMLGRGKFFKGGKPGELKISQLRGYWAIPIAADHSMLGMGQTVVVTTDDKQIKDVYQRFDKAGTAKYLFYIPPDAHDFTLAIIGQEPIRFVIPGKKGK
ncbi:MAG: hypothetical protein HY289_09990 [Planctomycetes bacterium]|nr:hypothetical protein [Planctomycetota bacterium]